MDNVLKEYLEETVDLLICITDDTHQCAMAEFYRIFGQHLGLEISHNYCSQRLISKKNFTNRFSAELVKRYCIPVNLNKRRIAHALGNLLLDVHLVTVSAPSDMACLVGSSVEMSEYVVWIS